MRTKILIAILVVASNTAQAKAKPQTPPPPVSGSCTLDNGIWLGHCQIVPPTPKPGKMPEKVEKSK